MATSFIFDGKRVVLPGVYTKVERGVNNPPLNLSYGNVLIIDKDPLNAFGGGSGINGEEDSGKSAIYSFDNIRTFRSFVGGGQLYELAQPLFRPNGFGSNGVSTLYYVRALTTTGATKSLTVGGVTLNIKTKFEGLVGNGVINVDTNILTKGFGSTISAGTIDNTKVVFRFWKGQFKGLDENSIAYDGIGETEWADAQLVAESPEISTPREFIVWAQNDFNFNSYFKLPDNLTDDPSWDVAFDINDYTALQMQMAVFAGGTQTYSTTDVDAVLDSIKDLGFTFVLSLDYGDDAYSADNLKIVSHLQTEARFRKYMYVAGGYDKNDFEQNSIQVAKDYDTNRVILVHGGCKERSRTGSSGLVNKNQLYHTAYILGRTCGLEPQTPITFKNLGYYGELHELTDAEREYALQAGVLTTYFNTDLQSSTITQGINTLQRNTFIVNDDGTSHLISVERIAAQITKEMEVNAVISLLGNQNVGPNRNTLSNSIVQEWVANFLKRKTATETQDNLILSYRDITVTKEQDGCFINFAFEPNYEVNKLFITGIIIDNS